MPTRSISAKTPVLGMPKGRPITASTSSTERPWSSAVATAAWIQKVPMRLAMKPGVSLQATTSLPRRRSAKSPIAAIASGRVSGPATTSSRRM